MVGEEDRRIRPPDLYVKDHEKWTVHVKSGVEIGKLKIAKEVFEKLGSKCLSLNKISRDTMRIDCSDKETANLLVKDQPFRDMKCYIPFHAKYCVGVIKDMDTSMSEKEINDLFDESFNSVYRMKRFDKVKNTNVPTSSVKVTMDCDELPEYVTVYGMRCKVFNFEQRVKVCYKCHRYGHYENNCKAEIKKCGNCGQYCEGICERETKCSSCNDDHKFGDDQCPMKQIEKAILQVMSNNKLSYFEAKDWIKINASPEAFSCVVKNKHFPSIQESIRHKQKKLSKNEINNNISLEIIKNVNEIKRKNITRAEKTTTIKQPAQNHLIELRAALTTQHQQQPQQHVQKLQQQEQQPIQQHQPNNYNSSKQIQHQHQTRPTMNIDDYTSSSTPIIATPKTKRSPLKKEEAKKPRK